MKVRILLSQLVFQVVIKNKEDLSLELVRGFLVYGFGGILILHNEA